MRQTASAPGALAAILKDEEDLHWDIALAHDIPLTLALKGGLGAGEIDLSSLDASSVKLATGVGKTKLTTPLQGTGFAADIEGG